MTTTEPIRLHYKLLMRGRNQGVLVQACQKSEKKALTEPELKKIQKNLHALDQTIVRELRSGSIFGHLADNQLARVLPLLVQRRTEVDGERLRLGEPPLRPRLQVEPGRIGGVRLSMQLEDPEDGERYSLADGRLIAGSHAYFLQGIRATPVDAANPWELSDWAKSPVLELTGDLPPKERDRLVRDLTKAGVPEDDLALLAVQREPPDRFITRIWVPEPNAANPVVRLILEADYGGEHVSLGNARPSNAYVTSRKNKAAGLIERDLAAEEEARLRIKALGFKFDKESATYIAKGEVALLALDPSEKLFPPGWEIDRTANAPQFHQDLNLHTEVKLLEEKGLLDLSIDINTVSDDEAAEALIEMQDLLKWLHSGKRYLQLKDGSYVAPSKDFRQSLKVLDDLGADAKRALVSPLCVGLLRAIGDIAALEAADEATKNWLDEVSGESQPKSVEPPGELAKILRDYQRHGLDWLYMLHRHKLTGILADDMGLGKTLQTLALLTFVRRSEGPKPSLVVAPTSVVSVWRDEAHKFLPEMETVLWHGPPMVRHALKIHDVDLVITSYGVLRRDAEILAKVPFRYVVLDEAQSAKNAASQNARAVRKLTSERRLALTGTPLENRPEELWATFDFLAPGFLGSLRHFRKRHARPISRGEEDAATLLRARIAPLVLRRLKSEVAKELPPKIESTVRCEMTGAQRALYDHISGELRESVQQKIERVGIERAQLDILAALTRLRQICCDPALLPNPENTKTPPSAKLALFEELMREALASDRRVVVFSQFVQMQKRLLAVIKDIGVDSLWLHGGTRNRKKVVDGFQDPNGPPVIVVSLKAGGTGVTLTRADTVMHYDPWWNPAVERQATDRTHRLGQTQQVTVYKLVCARSIEERVLELAERKDQMAESLLGSEGVGGTKRITAEDVMALLQ